MTAHPSVFSLQAHPSGTRCCHIHSSVDEAIVAVRDGERASAHRGSSPLTCAEGPPLPIHAASFRRVAHAPTLLLPTSVQSVEALAVLPAHSAPKDLVAVYHAGFTAQATKTTNDARQLRREEASRLDSVSVTMSFTGAFAFSIVSPPCLMDMGVSDAVRVVTQQCGFGNAHVARIEHLGERVQDMDTSLRDLAVLAGDTITAHIGN